MCVYFFVVDGLRIKAVEEGSDVNFSIVLDGSGREKSPSPPLACVELTFSTGRPWRAIHWQSYCLHSFGTGRPIDRFLAAWSYVVDY